MKNIKRTLVYLISILPALFYVPVVLAETLIPKFSQYNVEVKEDTVSKSCNLMLMLLNTPAPEVVNARLIAVVVKGKNALSFYALTVDVGDMTFINGSPSKLIKAPLGAASFDSTMFSSDGRLNGGKTEDGGVMLSTKDVETGGPLFVSFLTGKFSINFLRTGSSSPRSYTVSQAPPAEMVGQFRACVSTLR